MTTVFARNLRLVTVAHVLLISTLFVSGWIRGCAKPRTDIVMPVEFLVAVPPSAVSEPVENNDIPMPAKKPDDKPVKKPDDIPVKKPEKKPIKISDKIISNPNLKTTTQPTLSAEEIRQLMLKGAKPSDRTVIPEDDQIYKGMVKQAFVNAWVEPSEAEAIGAVVEVEIRLAGDGVIVGARISKSSGVPALDESVARALKYVKRVSGLSPDFISRYSTLSISFRVEGN
jgi:TonB family protein